MSDFMPTNGKSMAAAERKHLYSATGPVAPEVDAMHYISLHSLRASAGVVAKPKWLQAMAALVLLVASGMGANTALAQTVTISDGQATYTPGQWVIYTVTVTNNTGSAIAANTRRLRVPAATGLSISDIGCIASGATCPTVDQTTQAGQITELEGAAASALLLPNMPAGSTVTLLVAGAFHANASGSISKTATVTNSAGTTVFSTATDTTSAINVPTFTSCPVGAQYLTWTGSGTNHTGSMTPAAGFTGLPNVTSVTTSSNGVSIGAAESLTGGGGTDSAWANLFGASPAGNVRFQVGFNPSPGGFNTPAVQTLNFASVVAANSWGLLLADNDVEQLRIEAFSGPNQTGTAYSPAQINSWYRGAYDQDGADGRDLPRWLPGVAYSMGADTITGTNNAIPPGVIYTTDPVVNLDSSRASIWFTPGAPVQSLRITYQNLANTPTTRLYIASCLQPSPQLRLQKALPAGRVNAGDQFALSIAGTGAGAAAAVTTTGTGSTVSSVAALINPATAGSTYAFTEAAAGTTTLGTYTTTYSCSNTLSGGQTPSGTGTSFAVTPVAGDNLTCTFSNAAVVQPSFGTCDARMFLDQVNVTPIPFVSTLYDVGYASTPFTYTALGSSNLARNGIGYNPTDNYIYGMEWNGFSGTELIRIGFDGSSVNLGVVAGLPLANYNNGVISPAGDYYVKNGNSTNILYRINLATRTATPISLSQSIAVSDMAWLGGLLYGVDSGTLISINPTTGAVTSIGSAAPLVDAISMWGFTNGLFGSNGGPIYSIDPTTGTATLLSSAPASSNADGANCPAMPIQFNADLSVTKTNTPAQGPNDLPSDLYTPGEVRTYSIVVTNSSASFGAQNVTVNDPIPAGITAATVSWTCAATSGGSRCGAATGTGALNDTGLDLPPGAVATYLLTLTVPTSYTGNLTNTVTITPPSTINDTNAANNTATDVDQPAARVAISKVSVGGVGAFAFTGTNGIAAQTLTTTVAGTPVSGTPQILTAVGTATTITESAPPAGYTLTAISCTGLAGGTATPNLGTRTVSLNAAATAAGADIACTFTNTLTQPALSITKTSNGPWTVGQTGATYTLNVSNTGTSATSGTITVRDQLPAGIGIRPATGFTAAAGWICTYSDELAQGTHLVNPYTGMLITCASTTAIPVGGTVALTLPVVVTTESPASVINYASVGGGGDPFNGGTAPTAGPACTDAAHCTNATTSVTPSPPSPATCAVGTRANLFQAALAGSFTTDNVTQTQTATLIATAGGYTVGTGTSGRFVVNMDWRWNAGFPAPSYASTLTLRVNGIDYAILTTQDGFTGFGTLTALNGASLFGGTTTMETNRRSLENVWVTLPASVTTITSVQMVYVGGPVPSDDFNFSAPALYGCLAPANLSITKASTTSPVVAGGTITYNIVATNNGPSAANNAVVSDDWTTVPGLNCTAGPATCVASGTAGTQCPPPASVTPASLQAGLAIPVFPSGGIVTLTLQCAVTATGTP